MGTRSSLSCDDSAEYGDAYKEIVGANACGALCMGEFYEPESQ
jgi:hypothetical protein